MSQSADDPPDSDQQTEALELRSYGRRRGRKLSPRQERLMGELLPVVSPKLGEAPPVPLSGSFRAPDAQWASECGSKTSGAGRQAETHLTEIWLEIGFGGGEHLLWQARENPSVGIIGAEPFEDGVVKVLAAIEDEDLRNILVHADDARALLRWLPRDSLSRAFILFPDPWPKRRHQKRRLVNGQLLAQLSRVLRPGAELRIGTDIGDYARAILMSFQHCPDFIWLASGPEDWRARPADWPQTRYEQKALREGRRCYYLRFERR
jgi:tRNA (guanine-N7-)-methyltransferase